MPVSIILFGEKLACMESPPHLNKGLQCLSLLFPVGIIFHKKGVLFFQPTMELKYQVW